MHEMYDPIEELPGFGVYRAEVKPSQIGQAIYWLFATIVATIVH